MPDVIEQRIDSYYCHVKTEEWVMKPKPRDTVRCNVTVSVKHRVYSFWRGDIIEVSKLMEIESISLNFGSFLEKNRDFLTTVLSDPRCSYYFISASIERISQLFVSMVQQLSEFRSDPDPEYANSPCQVFPLNLEIVVDDAQEEDQEIEHEVIEESMQQGFATMPASNEAIHSLTTFTGSLSLKTEKCNICMEKFCAEESDENVKFSLSSMPCAHVFHHQCLVKWLQTSHTCPLCRHPMQTVKECVFDDCITL